LVKFKVLGSSPYIAREGWTPIALIIFCAVVVNYLAGFWWASPLWLVVLFFLQFFRDPERKIPQEKYAVVAPAHGRIIGIEQSHDPYLDRNSIKISIFMNVFSVHSNRTPVGGIVRATWYRPGRFFNAALDKASDRNERNAICINTAEGHDVVSVQVAGFVARRILCYVDEGQEVSRGDRYGFIRFGSRLDVYLPYKSQIEARLGQWVDSGSDIIGYLPENL
jgi:phosphatidylserine decarboxylase